MEAASESLAMVSISFLIELCAEETTADTFREVSGGLGVANVL